jgi:hypothetical protein
MPMDLEALRERAAALHTSPTEEALQVNEAILRLAGVDIVATRRLVAVLIKLGRLDRAQEVLFEALEKDPTDKILLAREKDLASALVHKAKAAVPLASQQTGGPQTWIKSMHYHNDAWTIAPGEEQWISDIGRRDGSTGERVYTASGEPWGRPSWKVGEEVGLYYAGTQRVPVLVEIISPPEFNPSFVQANARAEEVDAGERWPWVTWVRGLRSKPLNQAPTLDELGVPQSSMLQRARLLTTPQIHNRLRDALA